MVPATYNFSLVRGTTAPFVVRLQAGDPLAPIPFDDVRLTIAKSTSTKLLLLSVSNGGLKITDPLTAELTWVPTPEQSRLIPVGPMAKYELEVWNGPSELVYMMGTITGVGGINDDQLLEDVS